MLPSPNEMTGATVTESQFKAGINQILLNVADKEYVDSKEVQIKDYANSRIDQKSVENSNYVDEQISDALIVAAEDADFKAKEAEANAGRKLDVLLDQVVAVQRLPADLIVNQTVFIDDVGNKILEIDANGKVLNQPYIAESMSVPADEINAFTIVDDDNNKILEIDSNGQVLNQKTDTSKMIVYQGSSETLKKLTPNFKNRISIWGTSTLNLMHDAFSQISRDLNISDVYLGAKSGERTEQIQARFGVKPVKLTFPLDTIPESGQVEVTCDWLTNPMLRSYRGLINGVIGTLSYSTASSTGHYFTRETSGSTVNSIAASELIPLDVEQYRDGLIILCSTKNNLTNSDASINNVPYLLEAESRLFDYANTLNKFVIVMGEFVNNGMGSSSKQRVLDLNAALKARFGDLYFDIQGYMTSNEIWQDTGITPTSTDLTSQANQELPMSLSGTDAGHFGAAANIAIVGKVKEHLQILGWY